MPKTAVLTEFAPAPSGPYSQAVQVGPLLFVSAQIPLDPVTGIKVTGGMTKETEMAMENLKAVIGEAGATMDQIVKTTVYLSDMVNFKFMNQVYEKYFTAPQPARTTVQAKLPREALVAIDAIAIIG